MTSSKLLAFTSAVIAYCILTVALGNPDLKRTPEKSSNIFDELDEWLHKNIENVQEADPQTVFDEVSKYFSLLRSTNSLSDGIKKAMKISVKLYKKKSSRCDIKVLKLVRAISSKIGWIDSHSQSDLKIRETARTVDKMLKHLARKVVKNCESFIESRARNLFRFWETRDGKTIFTDKFITLRTYLNRYPSVILANYFSDLSQDDLECLIVARHGSSGIQILQNSNVGITYNEDNVKHVFKKFFLEPCKPLYVWMNDFFESVFAVQSLVTGGYGDTEYVERRSYHFKEVLSNYIDCKSVVKKNHNDIEEIAHRDTKRFGQCLNEFLWNYGLISASGMSNAAKYRAKKKSRRARFLPIISIG